LILLRSVKGRIDFFDFITRGGFSRGARRWFDSLFFAVLHFDIVEDTKLVVSGVEGVGLIRREERKGSERNKRGQVLLLYLTITLVLARTWTSHQVVLGCAAVERIGY